MEDAHTRAVESVRRWQQEIEATARALSPQALEAGVYESGWNARQLLCHLVAAGSFASFMLIIAQRPAGSGPHHRPRLGFSGRSPTGFDQDRWNANEVRARDGMSVDELMEELRATSQRSIEALQAAPAAVLAADFRFSSGEGGPLADTIINALDSHVGTHLAELRAALR